MKKAQTFARGRSAQGLRGGKQAAATFPPRHRYKYLAYQARPYSDQSESVAKSEAVITGNIICVYVYVYSQ